MSESKFDSLPREMVAEILDHFDLPERQTLRSIAKFWNTNISRLYGVTLTVNNTNLESSLACDAYPIKAYFQSLTLPIQMTETETYFLNRLTSLSLTGAIVCYNIVPVFEHCLHIQKLELLKIDVNIYMKDYHVNTDDPTKLLPELRVLRIKLLDAPFVVSAFNFLKTLLPFFISPNPNTGKLTSIVLECPRFEGPLAASFDNVFGKNSFQRTAEQMASNRRHPEQGIADQFYTDLLLANVKTIQNLNITDGGFGCKVIMKLLGGYEIESYSGLQITEFEHSATSYWLGSDYPPNRPNSFFDLLSGQTVLTTLSVNLSPTLSLDQVYSIANSNSSTMKRLSIMYQYDERLDGSSLSQLKSLEMLKYSECTFEHWADLEKVVVFERGSGQIYNLNSLPSSLRVLISSAGFEFGEENNFNEVMFHGLKNLETFALTGMQFIQFGQKIIRVVDSTHIRQFIDWLPSLKKLKIRNLRTSLGYRLEQNAGNSQLNRDEIGLTLPDSATDWINNTPFLSFQKIPIRPCPASKDNPALIGRYVEWDDIREPRRESPNDFPISFDGLILIQPGYRKSTNISD